MNQYWILNVKIVRSCPLKQTGKIYRDNPESALNRQENANG